MKMYDKSDHTENYHRRLPRGSDIMAERRKECTAGWNTWNIKDHYLLLDYCWN
jgi:hypothetical protein